MKEKMERLNDDRELRLAAYNRELNIMAHNGEIKEAFDNGEVIGIKKGKEIGKEIGKVEEKMKFIQSKYGKVEPEWVESLNDEQLESINSFIFQIEDYETFKSAVEKRTD